MTIEAIPGGRVSIDVDTKAVTVTTEKGRKIVIPRKSSRPEISQKAPRGTIGSLLPLFEEVFCESFPQGLSADPNFWYELKKNASHTPEKSVILLRTAGFSAEEVAERMMKEMKHLSPRQEWDCQTTCEDLTQQLTDRVRQIYASTVFVSPGARRGSK